VDVENEDPKGRLFTPPREWPRRGWVILGMLLVVVGAVMFGVLVGFGQQDPGNDQLATTAENAPSGVVVASMGILTMLIPWPRLYPTMNKIWQQILDRIAGGFIQSR